MECSLLVAEEPADNNGENSSGGRPEREPTSHTTFILILSTLVAVCGSYIYGNALGYSSPAESGIVDELGLSLAEFSVFGSILTIGAMLGAVFSGRVADIIGRRGAMAVSQVFCILGWLGIVFSKLDLGRFSVGCGIGLLSYAVPVYIAEITPKTVRGGFTSLTQLAQLGSNRTYSLRSTAARTTFISESPRWLIKSGRAKEFEATLQHLRGKNANISQEATDIKEYTESLQHISEDRILNLFQFKYVHSLIVGVGLMAFKELGGLSGFALYASSILESAGFPSNVGTIAAAVVQIATTSLGVFLLDKTGRRPILLISAGGSCLGCVLTGFSFFLQDVDSANQHYQVLIGVLVYLGSFQLGMGGIPWIIMSEIFPMNIKSSAGSLVNFVSWIGSWLIAYTFNFSFEWSSAGIFFIYAAICGTGVLFIAKVVPETKGRTLEEIQASMIDGTGML